jgi:hypothetical protein
MEGPMLGGYGDAPVVRRAGGRAVTSTGGVQSRHSFSFGAHYAPDNTHFGVLVASNDDLVEPGRGYPAHAHRDVEIVTWVLAGALHHRDSTGRRHVVTPGIVACLSAGTGVEHSEVNASDAEPLHFVQMWVVPDVPPAAPAYHAVDVSERLSTGALVTLAAGAAAGSGGTGAGVIRRTDAVLRAGRLGPAGSVALADAPYVHLFVASGSVAVAGVGELSAGDAARLVAPGPCELTAGTGGAELLVWQMQSGL